MRFSRAGAFLAGLALPLSLSIAASIAAASAGEKTLEFKLFTALGEPETPKAANLDGQSAAQPRAGIVVLKDGRIGTEDFIVVLDNNKGSATVSGRGAYTFDDGSITAQFSGTLTHGAYKILSGTGAYAGATGSGTYDSLPNPQANTRTYRVTLEILTPAATAQEPVAQAFGDERLAAHPVR